MSEPGDRDPGWRTALRSSVWGLLPGLARASGRVRRGEVDGLVALRSLFVAFCTALVLVGVVVVILSTTGSLGSSLDGGPVAVAVAAAGLVLLVASTTRRRLDGGTEQALAESYRTRFFLRIALSEAAALLGFVGFVLTGNPAVYPLGAAFSAVGFVLLAPTAANLARDQDLLRRSGSPHSLVRALGTVPPGR